jgi:hypothetical protein
MAAIANLVHQTATTTGTGNLTLVLVNGKQSFATAFSTGVTTDVFEYFISSRDAAEWERGTGHMSDSTTFVRDTVAENSSGTQPSKISFTAGTKDITCDLPATKRARIDVAQTFVGNQAITGTLGVSSDFAVATSKFTVAAATGNTVVAGTLSVTGSAAFGANGQGAVFIPATGTSSTYAKFSQTGGDTYIGLDSSTGGDFSTAGYAGVFYLGGDRSWYVMTNAATRMILNSSGMTLPMDRELLFTNQTSAAAAQTGTLTNAPASGNPGYWLKIKINATSYAIPCWAG